MCSLSSGVSQFRFALYKEHFCEIPGVLGWKRASVSCIQGKELLDDMTQAIESCDDSQRVLRPSKDKLTLLWLVHHSAAVCFNFCTHAGCNSFNCKFQLHCVLNQKSHSHVAKGINLNSQSVSGQYSHNGDFRSECLQAPLR